MFVTSEFTRHRIVDLEAGSEGVDGANNLTFHTLYLAYNAQCMVKMALPDWSWDGAGHWRGVESQLNGPGIIAYPSVSPEAAG